MAAAYPHIDRFLPCHDLASLEDLAGMLARNAFPSARRGPGGTSVATAMAASRNVSTPRGNASRAAAAAAAAPLRAGNPA
jgi:hypothetical protein